MAYTKKSTTTAEPLSAELFTDPAMAKIIADAEANVEYEEMLYERQQYVEQHSDELQRLLSEGGGGAESTTGGMQLTSTAAPVYVYNRYSGDKVTVNYDQLGARLKVRFDQTHPWQGQRVYTRTFVEPKIKGALICPLHVDSPTREHWDSYGLSPCRKHNLVSEYQVDRHVKVKHPMLHEIREREKAEADRAEQMSFFKSQAAALTILAERSAKD